MIQEIDKRIRRALAGIRLPFRGVGQLVNNAAPNQLIDGEGLADEPIRGAELMQHFGFSSNPPAGFSYVCIPIGGKTAHGIIVATEHATYRIKPLAQGEMAIYDDQGQKVHLTRTGIVIDGAGLPIKMQNTPSVTADTPLFHCTGKMTVDDLLTYGNGLAGTGGTNANTISGNLTHAGGSLSSNGKVLHTHTHSGVTAGAANTGAPV